MSSSSQGIAFNKTRQTFLATEMRVANTHLSRLRGLMGLSPSKFLHGQALWIMPCHGVHTWFMRFPVDVIYLDRDHTVVHIEESLRPWRFAPVRMEAQSVIELPPHTIFNSGTRVGDRFELRLKPAHATNAAAAKDPQAVA
jgi:uncharacterized membrane protein (UPF0127 family)